MRPLLAVFSGLLCALLGMRQARRLRQDSARLHRWEQLLRQLQLILQESTLPLPEAFLQAADTDTPADCTLRHLAEDMQRQPLSPLVELYHGEGPEAAALTRLFARLDRGSLESRVLAAEQAAQELALLATASQEKTQQDARMWTTLGWTCGACITLMLL